MPLDRCVISTHFEIAPDVIKDRVAFNDRNGTDILNSTPGSKVEAGENVPTLRLVFGAYGGIEVKADRDAIGRWIAHRIHVNPRNILHRHNGHFLSEQDCHLAFSILLEEVSTLLVRPEQVTHILPGLDESSPAHWSTLELTLDLSDPDETLATLFRNPHYPNMTTEFRVSDGSVTIGANDSPLRIKFYSKTKEMKRLIRKYGVKDAPQVFRVEITLRQKKLLKHLGSPTTVQQIDAMPKLVRFSSSGLIGVIRKILGKLQGCFKIEHSSKEEKKHRLPRYMALIAAIHDVPLTEQFQIYETYIAPGERTLGNNRREARRALARISPLSIDEVLPPNVFLNQPSIEIPGLERTLQVRRQRAAVNPIVAAAYR